MRYLGIDVHGQASVWCLLDQDGEIVKEGKTPTTVLGLQELATKLKSEGPVRAGQEVGTMAYLVHDAFAAMGVEILSFDRIAYYVLRDGTSYQADRIGRAAAQQRAVA